MAGPLDLRKEHKQEYSTARTPAILTVPAASYLAVDGKGPPASKGFESAISSIYPLAYTLKFRSKAKGMDFKVMMLECLWRAPKPGKDGRADLRDASWRLLLRVPDFIKRGDLDAARKALAEKGKPPAASVKLVRWREGRCVQALHVGPYPDEAPTVAAMEAAARQAGFTLKGLHHEIYLSDPGRTPAAKLRTILRHQVR